MPLAPDNVVSAWYSRTSWVYRAFSFLFVNPLWTKRVPNGFSLCPYWWSALFSIFIFRPFVYLVLGVQALARLLGLTWLLRRVDKLFGGNGTIGLNAVAGISASTIIGLLLVSLGLILRDLWSVGMLATGLLPLLCFATFIICTCYWSQHKDDDNPCRVQIYNRIVVGASVVIDAMLHWPLFVHCFVDYPIAAASGVWWVTAWLFTHAWSAAVYLVASLIGGIPYIWVGMLCFVVLAFYGWVASRCFTVSSTVPTEPKLSKDDINYNFGAIAVAVGQTELGWLYSVSYLKSVARDVLVAYEFAHSRADIGLSDIPAHVVQAVLDRIAVLQKRVAGRSALCKAWTERLTKLCAPFVWVWTQGGILGSYLWQFVKAKKSKNCPYLPFTD